MAKEVQPRLAGRVSQLGPVGSLAAAGDQAQLQLQADSMAFPEAAALLRLHSFPKPSAGVFSVTAALRCMRSHCASGPRRSGGTPGSTLAAAAAAAAAADLPPPPARARAASEPDSWVTGVAVRSAPLPLEPGSPLRRAVDDAAAVWGAHRQVRSVRLLAAAALDEPGPVMAPEHSNADSALLVLDPVRVLLWRVAVRAGSSAATLAARAAAARAAVGQGLAAGRVELADALEVRATAGDVVHVPAGWALQFASAAGAGAIEARVRLLLLQGEERRAEPVSGRLAGPACALAFGGWVRWGKPAARRRARATTGQLGRLPLRAATTLLELLGRPGLRDLAPTCAWARARLYRDELWLPQLERLREAFAEAGVFADDASWRDVPYSFRQALLRAQDPGAPGAVALKALAARQVALNVRVSSRTWRLLRRAAGAHVPPLPRPLFPGDVAATVAPQAWSLGPHGLPDAAHPEVDEIRALGAFLKESGLPLHASLSRQIHLDFRNELARGIVYAIDTRGRSIAAAVAALRRVARVPGDASEVDRLLEPLAARFMRDNPEHADVLRGYDHVLQRLSDSYPWTAAATASTGRRSRSSDKSLINAPVMDDTPVWVEERVDSSGGCSVS